MMLRSRNRLPCDHLPELRLSYLLCKRMQPTAHQF